MKRYLLLSFIFFFSSLFAGSWRVFVYMDTSDDLADMVIKNITDMIRIPKHNAVDIRIQLHAYDDVGLRYQVTKTGLSFVEEIKVTEDCMQDFVNAAEWGFAQNNADHTMLIFWNHGWGILDPIWNEATQKWQSTSNLQSNSCTIKRSLLNEQLHKKRHKGFMFTVSPRRYLTNAGMIEGLSYIRDNVLSGNKIDVVAFDTCMGGMFEILYQVASFTNFLVGNQVCALSDGFDYKKIVPALNEQLEPRAMAKKMVNIFDAYYTIHDQEGIYAHTALDAKYATQITNELNIFVRLLLKGVQGPEMARTARDNCPRFCLFPMYTDLVSFLKEIEKQLNENDAEIKNAMQTVYTLIQKCVVANCFGHNNAGKVHGCAIYMPLDGIDKTYRQSQFGINSEWIKLLECCL